MAPIAGSKDPGGSLARILTTSLCATVSRTKGTVEPDSRVALRRGDDDRGRQGQEAEPRPARTAVRTTRIASWENPRELEAAWKDLVDRAPACSVFQTFSWQSCWWEAFGACHELFVILAHAGSDLVGIAPMMIVREKGLLRPTRRSLHFIGSVNHASDYCDFITDPDVPEALEALLEAICAGSEGFDRIDLSHFPGHSPHRARTLDYLRGRGTRISVEVQSEAPVRILGDAEADRKAANKSSLRRHANFFRRSGELRFHRCTSETEILGFLECFFAQHRERWARTASPSHFLDRAQRAFYADLVRELLPRGWLRFDVVLFDGAPLAFHFGFEFRRRFIWYKPTFDPRYASRSPGEVLIKFLLEDAIEKQLEEFDFTVGSEAFKYRFANRIRCTTRVIAFRSATDFWTYRARSEVKDRIKRFLRMRAAPAAFPRNAHR